MVECYIWIMCSVNFNDLEVIERGLFKAVSRHSHTQAHEHHKKNPVSLIAEAFRKQTLSVVF
jgi:hypothetical protein